MPRRPLKKQTLSLLESGDLQALLKTPPRQIVNPLFGLLYHAEPIIRWRAVSGMGVVVSHLADQNLESARIIMRRLMWNLNDESGGIGWGSPQCLAEIMARHERLAQEFASILISYADPYGNYLEHPRLQQGVLWAWGRLGRKQSQLIRPRSNLLAPFLLSQDIQLQGLAAWAAQPLQSNELEQPLKALLTVSGEITIYINDRLETQSIGRLAYNALSKPA